MNSIMLSIFVFQPRHTFRVMAGLVVISAIFASATVVAADHQRSPDEGCCRIIELRQYILNPDSATSSSVFSTANL